MNLKFGRSIVAAVATMALSAAGVTRAATADSVEQYGITWKFDSPHTVGHFVNGDWWVVGPVKIVSVSPEPQKASADEGSSDAKSIYGATALVNDSRMRNGSMIVLAPSGKQGYDSRPTSYDPALSQAFPCDLKPNQSLISTISNTVEPVVTNLVGMPEMPKKQMMALKTAAILTCLDTAPPDDAFRPPYAGTEKPIYETKNIQWQLLPKLPVVPATPKWDWMERELERPWLDHIDSWTLQYTGPSDNQPCYGREFGRLDGMASLMLMLDVPQEQEQKQKLLIEMLQLGIDFHGLAMCGREWFADGGHWNGRKWPMIFASMMLNDPSLRNFPTLADTSKVYGRVQIENNPDGKPPHTLFSEDMQTYYGKGGDNQTVLWQVTFHTMPRQPLETKPRAEFDKTEKWLDGYRQLCSGTYVSTALAARLMNAEPIWDHDAFFDYVDRWMSPDETCTAKIAQPGPNAPYHKTPDLFTEQMWAAYRQTAKPTPPAADRLKWEWIDDKSGHFVQN